MKYIDTLNDHLHNEYTKTIYDYGTEHKYPIMELNGIAHLLFVIKQNNVKRILEIGTAISYSAHMMGSVASVEHLDTIERDLDTAKIAEEFINNGPLKDKINLIVCDALEIDNTMSGDEVQEQIRLDNVMESQALSVVGGLLDGLGRKGLSEKVMMRSKLGRMNRHLHL